LCVSQQYIENALLGSHYNSSYASAPPRYATRTLPISTHLQSCC